MADPVAILREECAVLRRQRPEAVEALERARTRLQYIDQQLAHYEKLIDRHIAAALHKGDGKA
jgi:hypothetical protein